MQVTTLDYDDYLGYVAIGRIDSGRIKPGDRVLCAHRNGSREEFRVAKLLGYQSLKRFELAEAAAGDICAVTGMEDLTVGETITEIARPTILPLLEIEEPTVKMQFMSNNGPFAGRRGSSSPRATCATGCSRRSSRTSRCAWTRPLRPTRSTSSAAASCTCRCSSRRCGAKATS